jgi:hypothetical protein
MAANVDVSWAALYATANGAFIDVTWAQLNATPTVAGAQIDITWAQLSATASANGPLNMRRLINGVWTPLAGFKMVSGSWV